MIEQLLSEIGIDTVRPGGNGQLLGICPDCQTKHLYVNGTSGLWDCKRGCGQGNLFELVRKQTGWQSRQCFELLNKHGLNDSTDAPVKSIPKDISWFTEQLRQPTEPELRRLCEIKQIDYEALLKLDPMAHKSEPIICLPAYDPASNKICGYLRIGKDGQLVTLKSGKQEKYPAIGEHGLLGYSSLMKDDLGVVLFCEAWRDALAAIESGFSAVASSGGASTFKDSWLIAFKDRTVYIVMDADEPGQKAAQRAVQKIASVAKAVHTISLPYEITKDHGKDLYDYLVTDGGDLWELMSHPARYENKPDSGLPRFDRDEDGAFILPNDHPDTVAEAFEQWSIERCGVRHRYNCIDGWSIYSNNKYQIVPDEKEVEKYVRDFIKNQCRITTRVKQADGSYATVDLSTDKKHKTQSFIKNILQWLRDLESVHLLPGQKAPCALTDKFKGRDIIAMNNGLLDITDRKRPILKPLTPDYYNFNYLNFDYDPDARADTWLWALGEYFDKDGEPDPLVPDIVHSWIKRYMLRNTSHHKILAIIGRKRSGKSTIGRTIRSLVGEENVTSLTIASLSKEFGLEPLLNKQLGIMWDAAVAGRNADTQKVVEILKSISGEDGVLVNRKGKTQIDMPQLPLSIMMIANKVLDLRDSTRALASRFTFLETTKSFYGSENPEIENRIRQELPGIFNLVLKAPEGKVIEHPKSLILQREFEELSSPYAAFINDWCEIDDDNFIPCDVLWTFYCQWCEQNNHGQPSKQKFKIEFNGVHDRVGRYRPQLDEGQISDLEREYNLDARPGRKIKIPTRPHCYKGIDISLDIKTPETTMNT